MNQENIGQLIRKLRIEKGMNQADFAEKLHISNKTVSKWECGAGYPDISQFPALSEVLGIDFNALFTGKIAKNSMDTGNLKRISFYICPNCGNLITATSAASVSCCGKVLTPEKLQRAGDEVKVELIDHEYQITSDHEMKRKHYISFLALRSSEQMLLRKLYPEWNIELHMPFIPGAMLIWYCTEHGLFYQPLPQPKRTPRK